MLPEVETFIKASEAADELYEKTRSELADARSDGMKSSSLDYRAWNERWLATGAVRDTMIADAFKELIAATTDPIARFIAERCVNYRHEAIEVLKTLPVESIDAIVAVSESEQWCDTFGNFFEDAHEAGAFDHLDKVGVMRAHVHVYLSNSVVTDEDTLNEVMWLIDGYAKAVSDKVANDILNQRHLTN